MYKRVLIAVKSDRVSTQTAVAGADLVHALNAEVALVHVINPQLTHPPEAGVSPAILEEEFRRDGQQLLDALAERLFKTRNVERILLTGEPVHCILDAARQWKADLIVVGTHGRGRVAHLFVGSASLGIIHGANCPVLVVRPAASARPAEDSDIRS